MLTLAATWADFDRFFFFLAQDDDHPGLTVVVADSFQARVECQPVVFQGNRHLKNLQLHHKHAYMILHTKSQHVKTLNVKLCIAVLIFFFT